MGNNLEAPYIANYKNNFKKQLNQTITELKLDHNSTRKNKS